MQTHLDIQIKYPNKMVNADVPLDSQKKRGLNPDEEL